MNRYHTLLETADLTVSRFDHPPHEVHEDPDDEVSGSWAISFVQSGSFRMARGAMTQRLAAGSVLLSTPGTPCRCRHDEQCPTDVCVSIAFTPSAASPFEGVWARAGWWARTRATPRLAYVDRRLASAVDANNLFEKERWSLAALTALASDGEMQSHAENARGHYAARARGLDAVVAVCESIERNPAAGRTVAERAREVGLTGTQLTHEFRRYVGESPHAFVIRWRLAHAAELRSEGWNVSESCYRAGFENLSHFSRSFQKALGVHASAWIVLSPAERRRKVQDLLRLRI